MPRRDLVHRVLAVASGDPILHHVAPLGMAAAVGRCLVIDLDSSSPGYSARTLSDLVESGIRSADLEAEHGVAVLGNGGVTFAEASTTLDRLLGVWGRIVLRDGGEQHPFPVVRVEPRLPTPFSLEGVDVVQATERGQRPDGRPTLPPLRRSQIISMLGGTIEPRWRWVRAWAQIWSMPWA